MIVFYIFIYFLIGFIITQIVDDYHTVDSKIESFILTWLWPILGVLLITILIIEYIKIKRSR